MTFLRSLLFNVILYIWTTVLAIAGLPLLLSGQKGSSLVGHVWGRVLLVLLRVLCGLTYEIRGNPDLAQGPVLVAAKHQSMWDTIIIPVLLDRPCFVLKQELARIPMFGWYLQRAGMIAVDRRGGATALKRMVAQAREAIASGRPIVIFPEGTRVEPGKDSPYHPGVAALYSQLDVPVVPVALNSGLFWSRRSFLKKPGKITIEFLPVIPPGLPRRQFLPLLKGQIEKHSNALAEPPKDPSSFSASACG